MLRNIDDKGNNGVSSLIKTILPARKSLPKETVNIKDITVSPFSSPKESVLGFDLKITKFKNPDNLLKRVLYLQHNIKQATLTNILSISKFKPKHKTIAKKLAYVSHTVSM